VYVLFIKGTKKGLRNTNRFDTDFRHLCGSSTSGRNVVVKVTIPSSEFVP